MSLSETQLAGLKKRTTPIREKEIKRVLFTLGLRRTTNDTPGETWYSMPITAEWEVRAIAREVKSDSLSQAYAIDFMVVSKDGGKPMGTVTRIDDATILQLRGAQVMAAMFESVDDLTPYQCPSCEPGKLSWDGRKAGRVTKAGMVCSSCDYQGLTGTFTPFRHLQ